MSSPEPSVKFTVTCLQAAECNVAFEPEGAVVAIAQGDVLVGSHRRDALKPPA
jgi:hypothetical protein